MDIPSFQEDHISQVPALELLQKLGYDYIDPTEAIKLRGGRLSNVLLDKVLIDQLRKINIIRFKGQEYPFSEGNIGAAVEALKDVGYDGLVRTNEKIYDLLCLGKSLQQSIDGDTKSFQLQYIDWKKPENNVYHVTEEFNVERARREEIFQSDDDKKRRPDIVLFVNGIPLVVIECKRPDMKDPIGQAVSQQIRNQHENEIPDLFIYAQLLMAVSKNEAKFATVGTPAKFWAVWKELNLNDKQVQELQEMVNIPLTEDQLDRIFKHRASWVREASPSYGTLQRQVTEQDRAIWALCRRERLLELVNRFILFDSGEKKIARYQQYFCVNKIRDRVQIKDESGTRKGGVVWHTQGSGKSLTMVMLAKSIALETGIDNYKIILVTDRVDLDDQIYKTFYHCDTQPVQAKTGRHLAELIQENKARIITTVIDKFELAVGKSGVRDESSDIFVLVDESHRGQYGELHAKMKQALPNACFIGFTGTPIMNSDKDTIQRFGGLIDTYTIDQAVKDKAVVPLLYEGRHVDQKVDTESIDSWFDRITSKLSQEQKADLKQKFASSDQLNKTQQKVMRIAWDVSEHFCDNWQGTPYKAQLVTQDKITALTYKKFLDEFDMVHSEVLISGPDDREGEDDVFTETTDEVKLFWKKMMTRYRGEKDYNRQIISAFKNSDEPEIIIVVDKLLTGFDAPRNTVLYLTRKLTGHTLLQAIARVNRLFEGKDFGYIIDYRGVLQNLDEALDIYGNLSEFDREGLDDLCQVLKDVDTEVQQLPQRYSALWELFKTIQNRQDEEEFELLLADEEIRNKFYDRLSAYSRTLAIALSSVEFLEDTQEDKIKRYRDTLKFFSKLRISVRRRYAEAIDFSEYEPKIQKLLDTYVGAGEIEQITPLVNIFDEENFAKEVAKLSSVSSKADTIAHRTAKTIHDRMTQDPAFYKRFSELLNDVIQAFRESRIQDTEYLKRVNEIMQAVLNRTGDKIPDKLSNHDIAKAYYGSIKEALKELPSDGIDLDSDFADLALSIAKIIELNRIVNWTNDVDIQNQMRNEIEDCLFEFKDQKDWMITFAEMDTIMEECLKIAMVRRK